MLPENELLSENIAMQTATLGLIKGEICLDIYRQRLCSVDKADQ